MMFFVKFIQETLTVAWMNLTPIEDNLGLQTIQICACSKASIYHLSHGLAIHSVCILNTLKGQDPS